MDMLDMAKMLGQAIAISPEMLRYKESESQVESDDRALQILRNYKNAQMALMNGLKEELDEADISGLKAGLENMKAEAAGYPATHEYLESKKGFDLMMKKVNDVIRFAISGECGDDKCKSCGGGCKH
jgi:cell fate (sporulation/competence/biofilm development) regulator YlbF (YheA/YmcA/DUF963 family)